MFSLITVLVSILIVGALVLAVVYYGGDAYTDSQERAVVARLDNEGVQVSSALTLYKVHHGEFPRGTSAEIGQQLISSGYLNALPANDQANWTFINDTVVGTNIPDSLCLAYNKRQGVEEIPTCSSLSASTKPLCCSE